jgi:hypothetical protein
MARGTRLLLNPDTAHGFDVFDADAVVDALAAPAVKVGGRVYVGVVLSYLEHARVIGLANAARQSNLTEAQSLAAMRAVLSAFFPRPWWAFWRPDVPGRILRTVPLSGVADLVAHFFASLTAPGVATTAVPGASATGPSATPAGGSPPDSSGPGR